MKKISILTLVLFGICTGSGAAVANDNTQSGLSPEITASPVDAVAADVDGLKKQNDDLRAAIRRLQQTALNDHNEMLARYQNLRALQSLVSQRLDDVAAKADGKLSPDAAAAMISDAVAEARSMISAEIEDKNGHATAYLNMLIASLNDEVYRDILGLTTRIETIERSMEDLQTQNNDMREMIRNYVAQHNLAHENLRSENQDLARAMSVLDRRMTEIAADVNARLTPAEVHQKIQAAIDEARGQVNAEIAANNRDVIDYFNQTVRDINNELNILHTNFTSRIENLETSIADLQAQNNDIREMLRNYVAQHNLARDAQQQENQNLARAMSVLDHQIKEIAADVNARLTPAEVHQKIQAAIDEARGQINGEIAANNRDVISYFNQTVRDINNELNILHDKFTSRIENLETDVADLKRKNEELLAALAQVKEFSNSEFQKLRAEIATKTDPTAVTEIVLKQTQDLGSRTRIEISEIIVAYKDGFPDGVRDQIDGMVAKYVGQKLDTMNKRLDLVQRQGAARDRINAAVNKLTEFRLAAGKGSVWTTKEGNFNGARLASDMTAGVVLGTVGGLVSSNLIKKSQIKNGLEDVRCTIGGQVIAEYGDAFDVGRRN